MRQKRTRLPCHQFRVTSRHAHRSSGSAHPRRARRCAHAGRGSRGPHRGGRAWSCARGTAWTATAACSMPRRTRSSTSPPASSCAARARSAATIATAHAVYVLRGRVLDLPMEIVIRQPDGTRAARVRAKWRSPLVVADQGATGGRDGVGDDRVARETAVLPRLRRQADDPRWPRSRCRSATRAESRSPTVSTRRWPRRSCGRSTSCSGLRRRRLDLEPAEVAGYVDGVLLRARRAAPARAPPRWSRRARRGRRRRRCGPAPSWPP